MVPSEADFKQQLQVNLCGLWLSLMLSLPILKQRAGLFVHVASDVIYNAGPWRAGYAASKAAAANSFDYSDNMLPKYLQQVAVQLLQVREQVHGKVLGLAEDGSLLSLNGDLP